MRSTSVKRLEAGQYRAGLDKWHCLLLEWLYFCHPCSLDVLSWVERVGGASGGGPISLIHSFIHPVSAYYMLCEKEKPVGYPHP